ncbi:ABC transporter ATP-binding protein/permease [Acetatifactor muris]|uniref:Lipid A export ATP-binding/permease protein MsbA n=1 Tax=Acetatifactor muris TaxID=879566 RepID=A0A2K4ZB31_9FIRM|nr:ABC transporter ATP-binding protein [Acetatifactor muris]MCR2046219.1 ABC transporter ATP-binding protein/permease [Acetatifactor muris]SOY27674.1 Lipid A export ATP-binding/permease protein MsbA [Acetatifactor muris]
MKALFSMKRYISRNWKLWCCGIFLPAFFSTATNIYFAGRLQNYVMMLTQPRTSFQDIVRILLLSLPVLLLLSWIDNAGLCVFSLFLASTENDLRNDFYKSLVQAPLKNLQKFSQGQLLTRYNTDIEQSAQIVSYDIFGVIYPLVVGTGYTAAVLLADLRIGFLMFLLGAVVILLNFLFMRRIKRIRLEILQAKESCTSNCSDAIKGKMSIRQYSAQNRMYNKIEEAAEQLYRKEYSAVRLETWKLLTSDAAANVCIYLLTPLACVMASRGYLSVAVVLFIHQLCRCFIMYTQNFAVAFIRYGEHSLSLERICPIMSLKSELTERDDNKCEKVPENFDVTFENVCAAYGSHQVLNHVSFTVSPGECIGIIGESGSGKSTLIKALMQLTDYQGNILIGGENCKNISLHLLRKYISCSPEHNDIFSTTVYDNIRYGNLNATESEIYSAAEMAGLPAYREDFFRRNIGENGDQLSGGQRQRVSLARALLRDVPVYIFDEPTAALDADSESKILNTISKLKQEGKCILLITHKASTLHITDRILRVEDGNVCQL